ncbi:efg1p_yarli ame: full=rrna-processing protein efg1 [Plasmopara halstedii]|uniref:rRNA-processing protein EFG1 n=1 Tax=Plasmopara halstedii TaxID=4781 RepID=A0A0P1AFI2_PLAHL|nr:efg1p_yarli ame: full=rrna-processing protein efg1 [Plasmopara halstedii]CEG39534.1 efg1p_yarli ame: full=rrna-processing protein efg1 [Plasmopara halstedii]|eukprot:XP_024575903.1 efg1p_yarli ame: full=rrna-processing protein efg1 [Plasmopara halstedii]
MAPTAGTRLRYKNARSKKPQQAKKLPSLKNRIRGIERFLSRGGLNDATRREKKAELEQLREEQAIKDKLAVEKKNAEKYKKSRFFERVKVMRKLRQAKHGIEQASDDAERVEYEKKFKAYQEEMMYIYYYPKSEPYLSLFPSAPHSMANQNRQNELRAEAVSRFAREQPVDAFNQFCLNGGKSKELRSSSGTRSAIELLLKKPTKEQVKKQKKMRNKRDKLGDKSKHTPVLVDQDDDDDVLNLSETSDTKVVVQEEDDFFL